MLIDIPARVFRPEDFPRAKSDAELEEIKEAVNTLAPHRIGQGLYQLCHWNPEHGTFDVKIENNEPDLVGRFLTRYELSLPECDVRTIQDQIFHESMERDRRYRRQMNRLYSQTYKKNWPGRATYGVCDYPAQVLECWPHLADDDIARVITFVRIRREDEPASGGWRYHKWGRILDASDPRVNISITIPTSTKSGPTTFIE